MPPRSTAAGTRSIPDNLQVRGSVQRLCVGRQRRVCGPGSRVWSGSHDHIPERRDPRNGARRAGLLFPGRRLATTVSGWAAGYGKASCDAASGRHTVGRVGELRALRERAPWGRHQAVGLGWIRRELGGIRARKEPRGHEPRSVAILRLWTTPDSAVRSAPHRSALIVMH